MSNKRIAHLALILVNLLYGFNYVIAKEVTPHPIPPFGFILLRVAVAFGFFYILQKITGGEKVATSDRRLFFFCALSGVAINQLLFFKGLSMTTPVHASLLMIITPVVVVLLSSIREQRHPDASLTLGIFCSAAGAVGITLLAKGMPDAGIFMGDVFIFINALSYAVYLVIVRPLMQKYHPFTVMKQLFMYGLPMVAIAGAGDFWHIPWQAIHLKEWLAIGYVIGGTTILAYVLNIFAMRHTHSSIVGIYIYLQPLVAALLSVCMGREVMSVALIGCAIAVFAGVYLVSRSYNT